MGRQKVVYKTAGGELATAAAAAETQFIHDLMQTSKASMETTDLISMTADNDERHRAQEQI